MLIGLFEGQNRVCFEVPRLPRARQAGTTAFAVPATPGGRRPHLEDLQAAGLLVFNPHEEVAAPPGENPPRFRPPMETYRVAAAYRADVELGPANQSVACFATIAVDSVQAVQRAAPGSEDHVVKLRYKVVQVSDWVRRLPPEALVDEAKAWLSATQHDASMVVCHGDGGRRIQFGRTCAGAYVEDKPSRRVRTGPQPQDSVGAWVHWTHEPQAPGVQPVR